MEVGRKQAAEFLGDVSPSIDSHSWLSLALSPFGLHSPSDSTSVERASIQASWGMAVRQWALCLNSENQGAHVRRLSNESFACT